MSQRVKFFLAIICFGILIAFLIKLVDAGDLSGKKTVEVILKGEKFIVTVADTQEERRIGLAGKVDLGWREGMLFVFDQPGDYGFWMKDMKFPLDIVWFNGAEVVYTLSNLSPLSYPTVFRSPWLADKVLEVKAGTVERLKLTRGDKFFWSNGK
jgi:hypothetical protein